MPTELMALIDAYAATSAVNGIRSQWAQMARGKVELALKQLPAPQMHTDAGDAELIQALGDLSFACFAGIGTQAPDAETFNRTFAVLEKHRALLATATGLPAQAPRTWRGGDMTVADLVNNLLMIDQSLPIYGTQSIEHPAGKRRIIALHPTVSRERVKDSRWIGEGDELNAAVIWTRAAHPDCSTCNDNGAVGNVLTAEPCPDCTVPAMRAQADARDDAELLDAMERQRIAVVPEYEGPWDAEVYSGDEKPSHRGSGSTPREAIRAAIAAAKGE